MSDSKPDSKKAKPEDKSKSDPPPKSDAPPKSEAESPAKDDAPAKSDAAPKSEAESPAKDDAPAKSDAPAAAKSKADEALASEDPDAGKPLLERRHLWLGLVAPLALLAFEMSRVREFTVDDSYISFRYAHNLARGWGLVYNEGERVEGYTNFLWTVIMAAGIKVGIDPVLFAKMLGGACAFGTMYFLWRLSGRLRKYTAAPCLATWLFATSALNSGYSVFGLETPLFVVLIVAGTYLFFREEPTYGGDENFSKLPWSGLVYGFAGITRPEAPMYIGLLMLVLGLKMFSKRNIIRGLLFVAPVGAHLLFRHSYYGTWTPNTFGAKTGNFDGQLIGGKLYVEHYIEHVGPILLLALAGVVWALQSRRRDIIAIVVTGITVACYVVLVGGDWMPMFRFLCPFEPFCFLLICITGRALWDQVTQTEKLKRLMVPVILAAIGLSAYRTYILTKSQRFMLSHEDHFWRMAAGGTAKWLEEHPRGTIAMGDIGYVGYKTDYPLLDLLGLVDPVIAKLPGGYTQKLGPGFTNRLFEVEPRYILIISATRDCMTPSVAGSRVIWRDQRFWKHYRRAGAVQLDDNFAWCIFEDPNGN